MNVKEIADQVHALMAKEMNERSILLGIERNNPQNLGLLHDNLNKQLKEQTFAEEHNLVLMTLYKFNPGSVDFQRAKDLLLKLCMHLGETSLCLFVSMFTDALKADKTVCALIEMAKALDSCKFQLFWNILKQNKEIDMSRVPGFELHVRKYISQCYKNLYSRVTLAELASGLNINEKEVTEFAEKEGMRIEDGKVLLNIEHETNITSKRILETIPFAEINKTCLQACK